MEEEPLKLDLKAWIKRDFFSIVVLLIAILVCMYSLYNIKDVEERTNKKWEEVFKDYCPQYLNDDLMEFVSPINSSLDFKVPT